MNAFGRWLAQFLRDARFSARGLRRSPGFTAITVASLALGIGGVTAMYSVIYGVVLHPFVYQDVDRLVSVQIEDPAARSNGSYYPIDQFLELSDRNSVFSGVIASTWSDVTWTGAGDPQRLRGNHCTMNTFAVMGVPPLIGRTTLPSDAAAEAAPVAVLGYKFWQRQFGGDARVLGRKLRLNGKIRTVIGVMPRRFMWRGADVYLPDVFHRGQDVEGEREVHLMGRLKPGVTVPQAEADLHPIIREIQRQNPGAFPEKWRIRLLTFPETFPSGIIDALWVLFGAVGLLLLIVCVNVSNLLLSRMAFRQKEIAIRASLGAGRSRIVSQFLSEGLVLALGGGLLGILAAWGALRAITAMVPPGTIPDEAQITLNLPILCFTLAVSAATAALVVLAPALQFSGRDMLSPLKEGGRSVSGTARQRLLRGALIAAEVALSVILLVAASLMTRTLISIQTADLGIRRHSILTLRIPFSSDRYRGIDRRNAFLREVLRRIEAVPGVRAAGVNSGLPPVWNWSLPVVIPGASTEDSRPVVLDQTNAGYAGALGLAVAEGHFLTESEVDARIHSAVVSQGFERRYFPAHDALGRTVRLPRLRSAPLNLSDDSFQIVGVVRDAMNRVATRETLPEIYIPLTLLGLADRIYVSAQVRPDSLDRAVRAQVYAVDPGQPVTDVRTLEGMLDDYVYARPRFNLLLLGAFAGLGMALALLGVYGVVSNTVAQRTREIGIRVALGARPHQVIGMVLGTGARLVAAGMALGLVGSLASVRLLSRMVRNVSPFDPWSYLGVAALLSAAGLLASYTPARRAARVDPVVALRDE